MSKYAISREFFPFSHFTPPINEKFLALAASNMKPPKKLFCDPEVRVERFRAIASDGYGIECFLMSPRSLKGKAPCLVYLHGGGFVLEAAGYHYKNAMLYAKEGNCRVFFVNYRLAPKNPHPVFFEDCYTAFCRMYANAKKLGIDTARIALGGDSAGAALATGLCMMARDRAHPARFGFLLLPYPFLDARNSSPSCKKYTDTPMWNSVLSEKIGPMTKADPTRPDYFYYSPAEAPDLSALPPTYIETAEFDCLHDDGILFAKRLSDLGIPVTLNETKGTIHGFDIVQKAPTTLKALKARTEFIKKHFC